MCTVLKYEEPRECALKIFKSNRKAMMTDRGNKLLLYFDFRTNLIGTESAYRHTIISSSFINLTHTAGITLKDTIKNYLENKLLLTSTTGGLLRSNRKCFE